MIDPQPANDPAVVDGPARTDRLSRHLPAALTLYAALAGGPPVIDPSLADPLVAATRARREHPWSPAALGVYVREVVRAKGPRLNRPQIAAWIRRQSGVARRGLVQQAPTQGQTHLAATTVGSEEISSRDPRGC